MSLMKYRLTILVWVLPMGRKPGTLLTVCHLIQECTYEGVFFNPDFFLNRRRNQGYLFWPRLVDGRVKTQIWTVPFQAHGWHCNMSCLFVNHNCTISLVNKQACLDLTWKRRLYGKTRKRRRKEEENEVEGGGRSLMEKQLNLKPH